ncbi:uncharacterized protein LOC113280607 [Papaver somniferum]|uniref:uncharacterized protein LOC113280607 n=1 Tax=Papaver somniferum TaxID=3469 RepID=UPI000E6FA738|nr:uncharacterized protein LOC113280607 [Papaver somniferum]
MGIKIDMSKAFDRVDWDFLITAMKAFGFNNNFCSLIYQCVSTTSIAVLLNDCPGDYFKPTRGLRQGDPLSPYLFIICMEIFSRLLLAGEKEQLINGVKITPKNGPISHIFFADACLLFIRANFRECHNLISLLDSFGKASGQLINFDKSGFFFSKKVQPKHQRMIRKILKIKKINPQDSYLGTALFISKAKIKLFKSLIEKMEHKIHVWMGKLLPQTSKLILNKSSLASMASYQMSCFILPKKITNKTDSIQRDFWWGKETDYKGYYPRSYSCLCNPKNKGGLGFRNAHTLNLAMITKLSWRMLTEPNALWVTQLKPRYFRNSSTFKAKILSTSSWIWKCISKGIHLIEQYIIWEIGDGLNTNIWTDRWITNLESNLSSFRTTCNSHLTLVNDLIDPLTKKWNSTLIFNMFPDNIARKITNTRISIDKLDTLRWLLTKSGVFSVKSMYNKLTERTVNHYNLGQPDSFWKNLWDLNVSQRIKIFIWKCLQDALSTNLKLSAFMEDVQPNCSFGCNMVESVEHLFISCPYAKSVWAEEPFPVTLNIHTSTSFFRYLQGFSLIVRDDVGDFKTGRAGPFTASIPEEAEALGLLQGAQCATEKGMANFSVEGDSKNLFDYLNGRESQLEWQNQSILDEAKNVFNSCQKFLGFNFAPRTANNVADILAKEAKSFNNALSWETVPPSYILSALEVDKSNARVLSNNSTFDGSTLGNIRVTNSLS